MSPSSFRLASDVTEFVITVVECDECVSAVVVDGE